MGTGPSWSRAGPESSEAARNGGIGMRGVQDSTPTWGHRPGEPSMSISVVLSPVVTGRGLLLYRFVTSRLPRYSISKRCADSRKVS